MRRRLTYPLRRWPRLSKAVLVSAGLLIAVVGFANAYILLDSSGESTAKVADVPRTPVAIGPGALVEPDGRMSTMLADRVSDPAALWHAGWSFGRALCSNCQRASGRV
jgi:vancomycin permeability regulator SanA